MKTKLIEITSLDQLKVGDKIINGTDRRIILAKVDLLVASAGEIYPDYSGWATLGALKSFQQEIEDKPWEPKERERYYYPDTSNGVPEWSSTYFLASNNGDSVRLAAGLCFKTKQEALDAAQKMLDVLKPKQD
jgi:hypothetical protein